MGAEFATMAAKCICVPDPTEPYDQTDEGDGEGFKQTQHMPTHPYAWQPQPQSQMQPPQFQTLQQPQLKKTATWSAGMESSQKKKNKAKLMRQSQVHKWKSNDVDKAKQEMAEQLQYMQQMEEERARTHSLGVHAMANAHMQSPSQQWIDPSGKHDDAIDMDDEEHLRDDDEEHSDGTDEESAEDALSDEADNQQPDSA